MRRGEGERVEVGERRPGACVQRERGGGEADGREEGRLAAAAAAAAAAAERERPVRGLRRARATSTPPCEAPNR
jgi:hypothetical protein